jgi:hypothetical protein
MDGEKRPPSKKIFFASAFQRSHSKLTPELHSCHTHTDYEILLNVSEFLEENIEFWGWF